MTSTHQDLNEDQLLAVNTTEGPLMVIAGPGSGKTRVIIHRMAHLIQDLEVPPEQVMAVTFTNKAAAELTERLERAVPPRAARAARVSNFHRLCGRLNRQYSTAIRKNPDYTIYDRDDQLAVLNRAMELAGITPRTSTVRPSDVLSAISKAKSLLITPDQFGETDDGSEPPEGELKEAAAATYPLYQRELELANALDFDDIILRTIDILNRAPRIQQALHRQIRYLMVDEYQDTNHAQHELTRLLTGPHRNLCVVGDPNQSIYAWRNALIRNILSFPDQHPDATVVRLGLNYRSSRTIVDTAAHLITHNASRINNPLSTLDRQGPPVRVAAAGDTDDEAFWNVNNIRDLVNSGQAAWNDTAVIYRTNAQSRPFEELCIQNRVPYRIIGGVRFYQRKEIKDVLAYLRLVLNPADTVSLQRIINLPPRSIGATTIDRILQFADDNALTMMQSVRTAAAFPRAHQRPELAERATGAVTRFVDLMDSLQQQADSIPLPELIQRILEDTGLHDHIRGEDNAVERWQNVMELQASTNRPEYAGHTARQSLPPFLEHISLYTDTDDYDANADALTLITLHQAKGLEFEAVAIPGMSEGTLPHSRAEDVEEERRLCYVGMTRAKTHLFLSWPQSSYLYHRTQVNAPSRFLDELPRHLLAEESHPQLPDELPYDSGGFPAADFKELFT